MNICPDDETITELDYCPRCNLILVGENKGKERFDVEAGTESSKKPKAKD